LSLIAFGLLGCRSGEPPTCEAVGEAFERVAGKDSLANLAQGADSNRGWMTELCQVGELEASVRECFVTAEDGPAMTACFARVPPVALRQLKMKKTEAAREEVRQIYEGAKVYYQQESPASPGD
jgi:hypothetical protein